MKQNNNIIEKVAKLLQKAESAKEIGSLEEANVFAGKVNELLLKHNLSMSEIKDIDFSKEKIEESKDYKKVYYGKKLNEGLWEIDLAHVIANYNFCSVIYHGSRFVARNSKYSHYPFVNFIGKKENIEVCVFLFEFLREKISNLSVLEYNKALSKIRDKYAVFVEDREDKFPAVVEYFNKYFIIVNPIDLIVDYTYPKDSAGKRKYVFKDPAKLQLMANKSVWIKSFLKGAVYGLNTKFEEEKKQFSISDQEKIISLVKVEKAEIEKYIKEEMKVTKTVSSNGGGGLDRNALNRGREVGYGLSINKGVEGNKLNKELQ